MALVEAFEAKRQFVGLARSCEQREKITITRHGVPRRCWFLSTR